MEDKSPLERDIELQEMYKIPLSILIIIAVLAVGLGLAGVYAFKLKQDLDFKERQIGLIEESFQKEKVKLVGTIKRLEADIEVLSNRREEGFPEFRNEVLEK